MRHCAITLCIILSAITAFAAPTLEGPDHYVPQKLEGEVFYVPVADGGDQSLIKTAKSKGLKINQSFFDQYHAPLVAAVRQSARSLDLSVGDQASLFGWLVIQTHNMNDVGYLWGGDLSDKPGDSWSTSGVGYDCSGYVWSVWEAIAPQSVFANNGHRLDSQSYRKFGRQVIPPSTANEAFIKKVARLGRPGDVLIMPGHICLFGYDPRSDAKKPIVMENGEFWNPLDKWLERYRGKKIELRSSFDEDGKLLVNSARRGRELPPMAPARPAQPRLIASAGEDKAPLAVAAAPREEPQPSQDEEDRQKVDEIIRSMMREVKDFDIASLPAPLAKNDGPNHEPAIQRVLTRDTRLSNDNLEFSVAAQDEDLDAIVAYRVRMYGAEEWLESDRPIFRTSLPGYTGEVILEFQVVDARGAASAPAYAKVLIAEPM